MDATDRFRTVEEHLEMPNDAEDGLRKNRDGTVTKQKRYLHCKNVMSKS